MPKTCCYLTMENPDGFFVYDHLTFAPLAELGWSVVEVPWTRAIDWSEFDAVVIRSPWDYQSSPGRFMETLDAIERSGTRLLNPADVCRWNMDKGYLRDLEERGVPIVPTQWLANLTPLSPHDLLSTTDRIVVKPTVGANADDTFVLSAGEETSWADGLRVFADKPVMVQPFLRSIVDEGEYSLFYFGGDYSHAIVKQPAAGDFRVQEEHGGVIRATTVDQPLTAIGQHTIDAVGQELLYARVDIVRLDDGSLAVIELELIEPSLYFSYDEESPRRFASAFLRMMG